MSTFIKTFHKGLFWRVEIWEKRWSEEMQSNIVVLLTTKNFITKTQLEKWKNNYGKC